ncbi:MAG: GNAT family N-acetyltransferase [Roseibium sp.]|uniref:GNAT family N-acetyltransferase n=1 Tax=Roseibium sp. TaxID=1936156 RepID=UPI001B002C3C|nr:GNAT family N-acetyltransferase [Roseibium sp.]MBO6892476.1 GNAT family N-acetyltransferase [Roseibium sp.]MBO6931223.1 GNAT family N-acetyltransferase [Roseibium sp.]
MTPKTIEPSDAALSFQPEAPVSLLSPTDAQDVLPGLGGLLKACVEDGAGIGFILPLSQGQAEDFWQSRLPALQSGEAFMMVSRDGDEITGVVMLVLAPQANGQHRAEVAKLMVHPDHRRKGLARHLMTAIDGLARSLDRWLLVLDTVTGDRAEKLYPTCGYRKVGTIPDYAYGSHGNLDATTVFYKDLREQR